MIDHSDCIEIVVVNEYLAAKAAVRTMSWAAPEEQQQAVANRYIAAENQLKAQGGRIK